MVGFCHRHIPTIFITDKFPPWWVFVMVGICWVTILIIIIIIIILIPIVIINLNLVTESKIICWWRALPALVGNNRAHVGVVDVS